MHMRIHMRYTRDNSTVEIYILFFYRSMQNDCELCENEWTRQVAVLNKWSLRDGIPCRQLIYCVQLILCFNFRWIRVFCLTSSSLWTIVTRYSPRVAGYIEVAWCSCTLKLNYYRENKRKVALNNFVLCHEIVYSPNNLTKAAPRNVDEPSH